MTIREQRRKDNSRANVWMEVEYRPQTEMRLDKVKQQANSETRCMSWVHYDVKYGERVVIR